MASLLGACGGGSGGQPAPGNANSPGTGSTGTGSTDTGSTATGSTDTGTGNPPNNGSGTPHASSKTGILSDGKIAGVSYKTSSGLSGTTSMQGEFSYNEGDSVTFSVGTIQLGEPAAAKAVVTPLDLSPDQTVRNNLMVFLQSLDANANHADGIQISSTTTSLVEAAKLKLNFAKPAADFAADADFKNLLTQSGGSLVSPQQALTNFQSAFYKDIQGAWLFKSKDGASKVLIYFDQQGNFTLGQAAPADKAGTSGIETGNIHWNASTGKVNPSFLTDTNGEWGLSHPIPSGQFLNYGKQANTLVLTEGTEQFVFEKVKNKDNSIVGVWEMPDHVFGFFEDNSYFLLYTGQNECATQGLEAGTYSATGNILKASKSDYDSTGCSGLVDTASDGSFDLDEYLLSVNQDSMTVQYPGEAAAKFKRVK